MMPKNRKDGEPDAGELPSTLQRSGAKALHTFAKAHDVAAQEYRDAGRARQVAFTALKRAHEKVADHWEPKDHTGPSDARAAEGRSSDRPTAGGVDANASKKHLAEIAGRLRIPSRSSMTKAELVQEIQKANERETARARR
jgi:hypothetical protein